MKENNFQVSCPSCETLFEVTDPELVGQIVACPKCGGMMMIAPPEQVVEDDKSADAESQDSPKEQEPDAASLDARERSQQEEPGAAQERRESPSEQRDVLASEICQSRIARAEIQREAFSLRKRGGVRDRRGALFGISDLSSDPRQ